VIKFLVTKTSNISYLFLLYSKKANKQSVLTSVQFSMKDLYNPMYDPMYRCNSIQFNSTSFISLLIYYISFVLRVMANLYKGALLRLKAFSAHVQVQVPDRLYKRGLLSPTPR
jgi:hypothetical protein